MSHRIQLLASAAFLFFSLTMFSQTGTEAQLLHPEVQRYTDLLNLSEDQTESLQAVYVETAARGKEVDTEMKDARMAQRDNIQNATPSEKEQFRTDMNELSKERLMLKQERADKLQELLTPEQQKILEENTTIRPKG